MKTSDFGFRLLLLIVLFSFLVSCRTTRQVAKTEESTTEKSIEKTTYKDTLFHTASAKADLQIPLSDLQNAYRFQDLKPFETSFKTELKHRQTPKEKPKIWQQKNGNATASVKVVHDSIYVTAHCDSITLAAKIKKEFFSTWKNQLSKQKEVTEVQKTSFWGSVLEFFYGLIIGFIIGLIIGFFLRTFIKI